MPTAATIPIHPHAAPDSIAATHALAAARASLAEVEARLREVEEASHSLDALLRLNADRERSTLYQRHLSVKADVIKAERALEQAHTVAIRPWRNYWQEQYTQAALTFLQWLEHEARPANEAMLRVQDACEAAGIHVQAIHVPQLLPDAIAHRITVSRQGLDR
jgi:hypothetical protein